IASSFLVGARYIVPFFDRRAHQSQTTSNVVFPSEATEGSDLSEGITLRSCRSASTAQKSFAEKSPAAHFDFPSPCARILARSSGDSLGVFRACNERHSKNQFSGTHPRRSRQSAGHLRSRRSTA